MKTLLCIMHARDIPEVIQSYEALDCDLAWMTGFYERDLVPVHADIVQNTDYDHYLMVSDDCVVTQGAVDAVVKELEQGRPAVTGWCSLIQHHRKVNLCRLPLAGDIPRAQAYVFYTRGQVLRDPSRDGVPTHFMGMSLTGMSRDMWLRFPFECFFLRTDRGHSSDFHLSTRLRDAGVPMFAPKAAEVDHLKRRMTSWIGDDDQKILIGEVKPEVKMRTSGENKMRRPNKNKKAPPIEQFHAGGGWYELPDGKRMRGKAAARVRLEALVREGKI